jgi:hypothetical protein
MNQMVFVSNKAKLHKIHHTLPSFIFRIKYPQRSDPCLRTMMKDDELAKVPDYGRGRGTQQLYNFHRTNYMYFSPVARGMSLEYSTEIDHDYSILKRERMCLRHFFKIRIGFF